MRSNKKKAAKVYKTKKLTPINIFRGLKIQIEAKIATKKLL